jgi:hypothetical protein
MPDTAYMPPGDNAAVPLRRALFTVLTIVLLSGCTANSPTPSRSSGTPAPAGAGLRCQGDDHGLDIAQLGWGFCYPSTWRFREREVGTTAPTGVDTTLDIVGAQGFFAFMIIGSYERSNAASLKDWLSTNEPDDQDTTPIQWGNAEEAVQVTGQLKRYAMTPNRVYLLSEREGAGNLDLEAEMSKRLSTWMFGF